ncbi:MAG: peptidase M17 [Bacteroidota bacterium]|nr:peptidase M17 [Bacteroidota bacterium]
MTQIQLKNKLSTIFNILIVSDKFANSPDFLFPKNVSDYIEHELKKEDKKSVSLNYLGRYISVLIVDSKGDINSLKEKTRKHSATVTDALNALKAKEVFLYNQTKLPALSIAAAEGLGLANYQFNHHVTSKKKQVNTLKTITIVHPTLKADAINELNIIIDATSKARDLVNEPVNILNATDLANAFKNMGKNAGFNVDILNKSKIKNLKMGGLLAVNAGSVDEPTFSIMEYKPKNAKNKNPYVLVGKGVVYDTGGLSLKPTPNSMDLMKCDMAGAAAVGCAMYAIAKAKLNIHVIGLVPATDNRPGFNAFAPGDIITMMDGTTVEMLNSDAEGRMILADALHYAKRYKPELTIDLATLTGAAAAAIGSFGIVGMGTAKQKQKEKLYASGFNVHERIAEFPFWEEYDELIKSDIADQKNLGGPYGGAITAGKFLAKYTDYPYYHLDIAGPAFVTAKDSYRGKGGTGYGVRLLFDFFKNL